METCVEPPIPPPNTVRRAVIDVGTNSVKLLVGWRQGPAIHPLHEGGVQTRLGEGFFATRQLRPEAIRRTASAAARFHDEARSLGAVTVRLLATAAAREAVNRTDLLAALRDATHLEPEVLSGNVEAAMAFRGVCSHPTFANAPLLVTDLGGGSTEFIVGQAGLRRFSRSVALGAVRLLESLAVPDHPTPADLERCRAAVDAILAAEVAPELRPALTDLRAAAPVTFVAVGGTAVVLARMIHELDEFDRHRIESAPLHRDQVIDLVEHLWSLPLAARRRLPGLPPERADVMLTGAVVYERILRGFDLPGLHPSTRGLRFAALLETP